MCSVSVVLCPRTYLSISLGRCQHTSSMAVLSANRFCEGPSSWLLPCAWSHVALPFDIFQVEASQAMIRVVGLSATLPNYGDVATFLNVNHSTGECCRGLRCRRPKGFSVCVQRLGFAAQACSSLMPATAQCLWN